MIGWLFQTLFAVTLLMVAVLALRRPVAHFFGAGWAYALWLVPAMRLMLPPLDLFTADIPLPPAVFIPTAGGGTAPLPAEAGPGQWVPLMLATWAGGAVIFLILQWLAYRAFLRRLDGGSRPARPPFYEGIATFVSEVVDGPLALGLLRRRIVVPADFSRRYSPGERRHAMAHERTHHRHGDIWWNMAAMLILALNWFNPVAWIAFRAFRTDQELACDAAVAARANIGERCDYARALVKSATSPGLIAACSMNDAGELKRRLRMMKHHRVSPVRSLGGVVAVTAFALVGFGLGSAKTVEQAAAVPVARIAQAASPLTIGSVQLSPVATSLPARVVASKPRSHEEVHVRRAAAPAREKPQLALAGVEPKLEPLDRLPVRMPRLRVAPVMAETDPNPRPIVRVMVSTTSSGTYFIRTADDPAVRERIRQAIEEAISHTHDARKIERLERVERVLGGVYIATIVAQPEREFD